MMEFLVTLNAGVVLRAILITAQRENGVVHLSVVEDI
jgi:hypothetical protein